MKVRLYVEGGPKGTHADGLRQFRNGFKRHLLRLDARLANIEVSPCGDIDSTIRDFARAARECKADCVVALLVDSDGPVTGTSPAAHLETKLNSGQVPQDGRRNLFLMVQCMEAWFVADPAALEHCFGRRCREVKLPQHKDVEAIPTRTLEAVLDDLAGNTPTRKYHKIRDAVRILAKLDPGTVGARSRHARELHDFLRKSAAN